MTFQEGAFNPAKRLKEISYQEIAYSFEGSDSSSEGDELPPNSDGGKGKNDDVSIPFSKWNDRNAFLQGHGY